MCGLLAKLNELLSTEYQLDNLYIGGGKRQ
jgi:hypothetical protein